MRILSIDTSTNSASAALLEDTELIVEVFVNLGTNHSTTLLPAVQEICCLSGVHVGDMDLFVCTIGPGSFTGIRIGVATVKGFAFAAEKPVIGVSTLDTLAWNLAGSRNLVCPMLDARKNQVYTALYSPDGNYMLRRMGDETVADVRDFLQSIDREVVFLGDGAEKYSDIIKETLPGKAYFTAGPQNRIRASMAGILGGIKYHAGERMDAVSLMPKYLRLSEAEMKMGQSS
jgi:tRNA threonylcarbamoyladenosine biosynthesis protein TsaB